MRVLGIEVSGTSIRWIVVDGSSTQGRWEFLDTNTVSLPSAGACAAENYKLLQHILTSMISDLKLDMVAVIRADQNSGIDRVKVEVVVEYACLEAGVPCKLIHVNSIVHAQKSKFHQVVKATPATAYGGGTDLAPKYLLRAFYCAWKAING
jgi:hypothetical protein